MSKYKYFILVLAVLGLYAVFFKICFSPIIPSEEVYVNEYLNSTRINNYEYSEPINSLGQKVEVTYEDVPREYYYFLPKNYTQDTPVIVVLHGSARTGAAMIDTWATIAQKKSLIIIAPSAREGQWIFSNVDFRFIKYAFESVAQKYALTTKNPFLFGHSNGGLYALILAVRHPEFFPVVASHAAAIPNNYYLPFSWFNAYGNSRIGIFLGDRDDKFSVTVARQNLQRFVSKGINTKLTIFSNHNHWYYDDATKINTYVWDFFNEDRP